MQPEKGLEAARELHEISLLLRTGLDPQALNELIRLVEYGVNPDALAKMVNELRKDL
jgi:mitotic-spindle organizing protein 1